MQTKTFLFVVQDGGGCEDAEQGSNSTTPRGSMEFLPPPPPHLLHSDEEDEGGKPGVSNGNNEVVMEGKGEVEGSRRGLTVAESVRELQRRQSSARMPSPASPATLRYTVKANVQIFLYSGSHG